MDKVLKTLIYDNQLSLSVLETTDMVNKAIKLHNLTPVCAAALGRALTISTFISSGLKNDRDNLYVTVAGDGPGGKITVCGNRKLEMRASIDNVVDLPLKSNGKLDVGGLVGRNGRLTIVKNMGLKEPYSGSSKLISGELGEDFAAYFTYSEQQPTAIAVGVKIGKNLKCVGAGAVIIQALPYADEKNLIKAEELIGGLTNVSTLIEEMGAEKLMQSITDGEYYEYLPKYKCNCSKRKVDNMLFALGEAEINDILEKEGTIKVNCQFCNKEYVYDKFAANKLFNKK